MNAGLRSMYKPRITAPEWAVLHDLRGVLRLAGDFGAPEQGTGGRNAFSYRPSGRETWPGQRLGVRAPAVGETPLSAAEVSYLFRGIEP